MNNVRELVPGEKAAIIALLKNKEETGHLLKELDDVVAKEHHEGGKGSLLLIPRGLESQRRSFGRLLVLGEFLDSDGTPVLLALNLDSEGHLYELDVLKVGAPPLIAWGAPDTIRILE